MAEHVLYGKKKLCYTEVMDFTDFQGIGRDPLYKRFDSVYSVIEKNIEPEYVDFLAHPIYSVDDDQILWYVKDWNNTPCAYKDLSKEERDRYRVIKDKTIASYEKAKNRLTGEDKQILTGALKHIDEDFMFCYDNKVVVVAWGMMPDTHKHVVKGAVIHDLKIQTTHKVHFVVGEHGILSDKLSGVVSRNDGAILSHIDLPVVTPKKGFSFKGWDPNPIGIKVNKSLTFTAMYEEIPYSEEEKIAENIDVEFLSEAGGEIHGKNHLTIEKGTCINPLDIPSVSANEGYVFDGWDVDTNATLFSDTKITAKFKRQQVTCRFNAGEHGSINGQDSFIYPYGTVFNSDNTPKLTPQKGYKFIGWDKSPIDYVLNNDTAFTAQYERVFPWYKSLWMWLTGKGCLKWLLWLLLFILFLLLISWLIRQCDSGTEVVPSDKIETSSGKVIDDNGTIKDIVGNDGKLPDNNIVAPIVGEDGANPPIIQNPGAPDIVGNRLNIYFEDANVNLEQFVSDLSVIYDKEQCKVIGMDKYIPMIQILVSENQRNVIRESLNSKLPNYKFFIVDESIFTIVGEVSQESSNVGWHLKAIDVEEGWEITKGDPNIIVAVVDDGIDASHDILKGRIVKPYNVFTQDNRLSTGQGHGTHVAGLAVGSDKMFDKGVSGIAPKCKLMPVQVFDNGMCTFSSVTSGIMYAIHNGANVINVSIGPNFRGLDILPIRDQDYIARTQFKNEEKVWKRIINVANDHNAIIVFAAGNDNILASIPPENRTNSTVNVAAVDMQIKGTDFTNYGNGSNISAPGKGIYSSVPINDYAVFDGTSMAAPIVSGTIALMKSCKPGVEIADILHILQATGQHISDYVPPMIQVDDALIALKTGVIPELPSTGNDKDNSIDSPNINSGDSKSQTGENPLPSVPENNKDNIVPSNGINDSEADKSNNSEKPDVSKSSDGTDYDAIRRLIEAYKKKISELEKLLPENE